MPIVQPPAPLTSLTRASLLLWTANGDAIARLVLRDLLVRVEAADVTHEEAATSIRTALAAMEGRQ